MTRYVDGPGGMLRTHNYTYCGICGVKHFKLAMRLCDECTQLPLRKKTVKNTFCSWCGGMLQSADKKDLCRCGVPM